MIVEMLGAPGSGKTSLIGAVGRSCAARGLCVYTINDAPRVFARRCAFGRVVQVLCPQRYRSKALWAVFRLCSGWHTVSSAWENRSLTRMVIGSQRSRPSEADAGRRRVLYWFFRTMGTQRFIRTHCREEEVVVLDEGYAHRVVQLFCSSVELPTNRRVADYIAQVPSADLVIHVDTPTEECVRRVAQRGTWERLSHRSAKEIADFVHNAHEAVDWAVAALRTNGRNTLTIDNGNQGLEIAEATLMESVDEFLAHQIDGSANPPRLPVTVVPRPRRLAGSVRARFAAPGITRSDAESVLTKFGATLEGRPRNLSMGWRNNLAVAATSEGSRVIKGYRETSTRDRLAYEHAILEHLARRGFPAVRLCRSLDDESLVEHRGVSYALFEFQPGRHFASSILTNRQRHNVITEAGRTLGVLHHALEEFCEPSPHPLGIDRRTGRRVRDLEWYLFTLDDLRGAASTGCDQKTARYLRFLRDHAERTGDALRDVSGTLRSLRLPTAVIHGDYGTHNLLFPRETPPVVHDFELARYDWRLLDFVIAFGRLDPAMQPAFLAGYRETNEIGRDELDAFTDVRRHHLLTGAVRSWDVYRRLGGIERLETACRRTVEAEQ